MDTVVPPGFHYEVWVSAAIDSWVERSYGEPQALFYSPTGVPSFAEGFSRENMTPKFASKYE